MRERGVDMNRKAFPVLPWSKLSEPMKVLKTPYGTLLVDGWYRYARKMHYTSDIVMALCWGLYCGLSSFLPFYYCCFFTVMIVHRWRRDEEKCRKKYKEYWDEYKKMVPYVFLPGIV
jgi:delta24(24(1))-sterol reductase